MLERPRITLDPGHGGDDRGVVEYGLTESLYVREFAEDLALGIRWMHPEVSIRFTRTQDDVDPGWDGRREEAEGSELVLSLHLNGHRSPVLKGALALYWPGNVMGEMVADAIARAFPSPLYRANSPHGWRVSKGNWPRAYNVVRQYRQTAVLVELGYATSPTDAEALADDVTRQGLIVACLQGVNTWMRRRRQWPPE